MSSVAHIVIHIILAAVAVGFYFTYIQERDTNKRIVSELKDEIKLLEDIQKMEKSNYERRIKQLRDDLHAKDMRIKKIISSSSY